MKVLILAPQPYFSHRGTPMNVRTMLTILSGAGIEVDLLTYPLGEDTPLPGLTIHRVPRPPGLRKVAIGPSPAKILMDLEMLPAAFRLAGKGGYRMVHAIEESVFIGLLLKRRYRFPLLYDMDSSLREQLIDYGYARGGFLKGFLQRMENAAIRGSDGVITVCGALSGIVRAVEPAKPVYQIEDIPLCLDNPEIPPDAPELARRFSGRKVLLYTGNFEPYQGVRMLLEALPQVRRRFPEALLVLVGGGGREAAEMAEAVRALGDGALAIEPRPLSQMDWFMARAGALLSPRIRGINTPLKVYTYLQSGRPVVATRLPTHTQVLEDGWSVLVEPNPDSVARGIIGLLEDPARAEALGGEGRRIVNERYSPAGFREKLLAAYREVGGFGTGPGAVAPPGRASRKGAGRPAVFLDRDGVVNRHLAGEYVTGWEAFEFLPGAAEAIRRLKGLGYVPVLVTNQQGVGKGLMTASALEEIHRRMQARLAEEGAAFDGIYVCPHLADAGCDCRKPKPGLILRAAGDLGLDIGASFMAGDSPTDVEAARRAGCRPVLLGGGAQGQGADCPVYPDLLSFAAALAAAGEKR